MGYPKSQAVLDARNILLGVAIYLLNVGDLVSTAHALALGAVESGLFGFLPIITVGKAVFMLSIVLIGFKYPTYKPITITFILLIILFSIAMLNNLIIAEWR